MSHTCATAIHRKVNCRRLSPIKRQRTTHAGEIRGLPLTKSNTCTRYIRSAVKEKPGEGIKTHHLNTKTQFGKMKNRRSSLRRVKKWIIDFLFAAAANKFAAVCSRQLRRRRWSIGLLQSIKRPPSSTYLNRRPNEQHGAKSQVSDLSSTASQSHARTLKFCYKRN